MKKNYQAPELQKIVLETEEPVTAVLGVFSNLFGTVDEGELPEITEL